MQEKRKNQINKIVDELQNCLPLGFDELFQKLKKKHKAKKLTPLLTLLKTDGEISFDDLIKFFENQGYFLGVNIWKTDWAIIKVALEDDPKRRALFLEFINALRTKEQELKAKYQIPKNYNLQGSYFEEYKLLSDIEKVLDTYKGDLVNENVKVEIDYQGTSIMVSRKEISLVKEQIDNYIQKMLSSGFYEEMIQFQFGYFKKLLSLPKSTKKTAINFFRTMIRLTWEFNCLPWWIGMDKYRQFATSHQTNYDEIDVRDLVMPDEFTLFVYHLVVILNEFYAYLYFKSAKKNPEEELVKNNSLKKFITYGDNNIIAKIYVYNWLKAIFKPLVQECNATIKEAWTWVMDYTLKCIIETTSLNLIEQWHLKTISQDPYLVGIMGAFIEYMRKNDKFIEQNAADKINQVADIFAMVAITETTSVDSKLKKVKEIRKTKGDWCFNEIIDRIVPIEKFEEKIHSYDFLLELETKDMSVGRGSNSRTRTRKNNKARAELLGDDE